MSNENVVTIEDIGSVFEKKNKPILDFLTELKSQKINLAESPEKPAKNIVIDDKPAAEKTDKIELEESRIEKFEIMGIPVVPVAGGCFASVLVTEIIDGLLSSSSDTTKGAVKLATAFGAFYAGQKWGSKIPVLGSTGMKAIALLVAFDGIRDLTPLDSWAETLASKITGETPEAGLASHKEELKKLRSEYQTQNQTKASAGYYDKMLGGKK